MVENTLVASTALWICASLAFQTSHYTLSFDGSIFTVSDGTNQQQLPLASEKPTPPKFLAFRKDDDFAVWDARGLTVRKGSQVASYKFDDFPVDPKFFSAEEITQVRADVNAGRKSLGANGLSGARRIGQRAFFLIRWSDQSDRPWLEALVQVNLDGTDLHPTVLGKFAGLTGSTQGIDNRLFFNNNAAVAVTQKSSEWGLATYSLATRAFDFVNIGDRLVSWNSDGLFLETTSFGSTVGGQVNLSNLEVTTLFEDRNPTQWLDANQPPIAVASLRDRKILRNCESGLEQILSGGATVKRTPFGILAWSPGAVPQHAVLLGYGGWTRLAAWNAGSLRPQFGRRRLTRRR